MDFNKLQGWALNGAYSQYKEMALSGAMAGSGHTTSTADDFVPDLWADGIYKFFKRDTVFKGILDDYSALIKGVGYGENVIIPQITLKDASEKSQGDVVTYDATATDATTLTIDKHYYNAMIFDDVLTIQSQGDLTKKYVGMFGEALARQFDSDCWTALQSMSNDFQLAGDDAMSEANWQSILTSLGVNGIPYMEGDCSMVVNPTMMADILDPQNGISKYYWRADAGGDTTPLNEGGTKGFMGKLHGINVYMSSTISSGGTATTKSGAVFHKEAVAFAVQQDVRVQSAYSIDALGTRIVADMLYGVKCVDSASNVKGIYFKNAD